MASASVDSDAVASIGTAVKRATQGINVSSAAVSDTSSVAATALSPRFPPSPRPPLAPGSPRSPLSRSRAKSDMAASGSHAACLGVFPLSPRGVAEAAAAERPAKRNASPAKRCSSVAAPAKRSLGESIPAKRHICRPEDLAQAISDDTTAPAMPSNFKLVKRLGDGVFSYEDKKTGNQVAVRWARGLLGDARFANRVLREIRLLSEMRHPNLMRLLDIVPSTSSDTDDVYMVMPLLHVDMESLIHSQVELTPAHAKAFTCQILRGVQHLHSKGVMHGHLRPSTILVHKDCSLRLTKYGLPMTGAAVARPGGKSVLRSCWYHAPELLLLAPQPDGECDSDEDSGGRKLPPIVVSFMSGDSIVVSGLAVSATVQTLMRRLTRLWHVDGPVQLVSGSRVLEEGEPVLGLKSVLAVATYTDTFVQNRDGPADLWAAGCIHAELLTRQPLFPGTNPCDSLRRIADTLGLCASRDFAGMHRHDIASWQAAQRMFSILRLPEEPSKQFEEGFPSSAKGPSLDLLRGLLSCNADARPTAEQALNHDYLKDLQGTGANTEADGVIVAGAPTILERAALRDHLQGVRMRLLSH